MEEKVLNLILEKLDKIDNRLEKLEQGQAAEKSEKLNTMAEDIEYIKIKIDLLDAETRLNSYDIKKIKRVK